MDGNLKALATPQFSYEGQEEQKHFRGVNLGIKWYYETPHQHIQALEDIMTKLREEINFDEEQQDEE